MADETPLDGLLACPRCDTAPLERNATAYQCRGCKTAFPDVGGLPWLFADPDAALGEWQGRLHRLLAQLAQDAKSTQRELDATDLLPPARRRMEAYLAAVVEHRRQLNRLLAPIDVQSTPAGHESHLALRTRLPVEQGLSTYYNNVHRDWAWGERENEASLDAIRAVLDVADAADAALGDTLVAGAGAGRLAYDLHQRFATRATVALDFNPLLMFIAQAVTRGDALSLYEFPIAPRSLEDTAVLRTLRAPEPARAAFHCVLGDVLRAPFAAASFDTVVTPWLIDIVCDDVPRLAARINGLLKPGGRWVNFGSLSFEQQPRRARRYSPDEVVLHVENAGFAAPAVAEASVPYMCSPASRHGRLETVFTFCARKTSAAAPPGRYKALPDWLVTGKEPVPLLPSFRTQALSTKIYAFIMSLIDGRRTIADMAKLLEQQQLMTKKEAEPAIRRFLTRMYDDSRRQAGF